MKRLAFLIMLALSVPTAHARETVVELLVFRQAPGQATAAVWTPGPGVLPPCDAVRLRADGGAEAAFSPGDRTCTARPGRIVLAGGLNALEAPALATEAGKLQKAGHALLARKGWRQALANGAPILLAGQAAELKLSGFLALEEAGGMTTASLDLVLARGGDAPAHAHLVDERVVKPGELHYFDHPLFGVLLRLQPAN